MAWAKFDDKRHLNPKLRRAGMTARGLHADMITYSAAVESDGFVSDEAMQMLCAGEARPKYARTRLELEELIERDDTRRGWWVHDYLDYNPSKKDLVDRREADRVRKESARNPEGFHTDSARRPRVPTRPDPDSLQESQHTRATATKPKHEPSPPPVASLPDPFPDFWQIYPSKFGKPKAAKAFAAACRRATPERIIEGARRFRDDPNRVAGYTPYGATWLNRDGWDDPPLPARNGKAGEVDTSAIVARVFGVAP